MMAIIAPVKKDIVHPHQTKKYSSSIRLWHWANLVVISGSLITVLLNSTVTDEHANASFIKSELQSAGAAITVDQSRSVAGAIEDSVWSVHIYFGYCLASLLLFRLLLEFFEIADQKFVRRLKTAYSSFKNIKKGRQDAMHELTVKLIYAAFYLLLIIMVTTGLSLAFDDKVPALKHIHRTVKNIHGFCMYLILVFIIVHIAGVFMAERRDAKGIVSDMINGGVSNLK